MKGNDFIFVEPIINGYIVKSLKGHYHCETLEDALCKVIDAMDIRCTIAFSDNESTKTTIENNS